MTNEAVIIELLGNNGDSIRYTCNDPTGIEKGTILTLLDNRTVSGAIATTTGIAVAGIANAEKVASDGSSSIGVYTNGIFDLYAAGAINVGEAVTISGANSIRQATASEVLSGAKIGYALETASVAETIAVRVNL